MLGGMVMCIYGVNTKALAEELELDDWIFEGQLNEDNTYIFSDGSEYVDVKKYTGYLGRLKITLKRAKNKYGFIITDMKRIKNAYLYNF